jgi:hypothetical protein
MIEAPLVLATLLQRADFELLAGAEIGGTHDAATLRPEGGVPMRIKARVMPAGRQLGLT